MNLPNPLFYPTTKIEPNMSTKSTSIRKATSHRNAIRKNIIAFIKKWKDESREEAEAKTFWDDFFRCFGIDRKEVAAFEYSVSRSDNSKGYIDLFWKGVLLVEHKSRGKSLDKAGSQAFDYVQNIKRQSDIPRYVLLSDFAKFRLYDLEATAKSKEKTESIYEIAIEDLAGKIHLFDFMSGLENHGKNIQEKELNIKAAERLGNLHDALQQSNYAGHELEVFLVRILFCLFAEDTGIFGHHQFYNYILNFTNEDGSDTELWLHKLFQVLDKPDDKRNKNLQAELDEFPYVNGHLFKERLDLPSFDVNMREALLDCSLFDWGSISPAIFGSLFQSVMDKGARRELGAHYTSEANILKLIDPLFLDELKDEFSTIQSLKRNKKKRLSEFQQKLTGLQFLDPACGCGNFLIITYRELRRLELSVLREQQGKSLDVTIGITIEPTINLEHFHGIEIEEFPTRIAEVAMWLTQHQMNREFAKEFGVEPELLPLKSAANIVHDNALQIDWSDVIKPKNLDYIIGNPPFIGKSMRTKEQNSDMDNIFTHKKGYKLLDYVSSWFYIASKMMLKNINIQTAFVSTNSISQGEQATLLWEEIFEQGFYINFSHRTFSWESEARGKAAVHVVIAGFSKQENRKLIYIYDDIKAAPHVIKANNINPYFLDAPNVFIESLSKPLQEKTPAMVFGNMPNDGGNLLLTPEEKNDLIKKEPKAKKWIKICLGATEFLNAKKRWCLWLTDINPNELRSLPETMKRVKVVYNNFPWPALTKTQKEKVEKLAQKILDVREKYPDSSLADLYDSLVMPADLRKAHKALDRAVEQCYRKEKFKNEMDRLSFLFERYAELTSK